MCLWAIVPVKPLRRGKSRLAGVLSDDERSLLNYTMLGNTLRILTEVPEVTKTLVVSRDQSALALARDFGARTLQEDGNPGLNTALHRAAAVTRVYAAEAILILPADLPLVTSFDIQTFLKLGSKPPVMVIAPDRRSDGTNALFLSPAASIDFRFGPGSFQHHIQQARSNHYRVEVFESFSFGLDLDIPEDLELLKQIDAIPAER